MGLIIGKVWGTTQLLLRTPFIEIHLLKIKPYAKCSVHRHRTKWNAFFVQAGVLTIETKKNDYNLTDLVKISANEMTMVKPMEYHRFSTDKASVIAIEIYYPDELSEDIERLDCGSVIE